MYLLHETVPNFTEAHNAKTKTIILLNKVDSVTYD
jgi:hypothetical protein